MSRLVTPASSTQLILKVDDDEKVTAQTEETAKDSFC